MMEAAKHRTGVDPVTIGRLVSICASRNRAAWMGSGKRGPSAVWKSPIVTGNELVKNPVKVRFINRDHVIETFSSFRADESFAVGVRGGTSERRAECSHPQKSGGPVQIGVEHGTSVVDQEFATSFHGNVSRNC